MKSAWRPCPKSLSASPALFETEGFFSGFGGGRHEIEILLDEMRKCQRVGQEINYFLTRSVLAPPHLSKLGPRAALRTPDGETEAAS